jgi:hypothetical protein
MTRIGLALLIMLAGVSRGVLGQSVPTPPDESDPPGRAARLSVVQGSVSFRPAAGDTWALADQNRALTTGDRLWVDSVGRLELEIGDAAVRASNETELDIVRLDDNDMQFRLPQGSAFVHLGSFNSNQNYELDAPNAAITFEAAGEYRVDVSADGQTATVTAWSGQAAVTAGGQSFNVQARQSATITGDSTATYNIADAGSPDTFDSWSEARDQRYARPPKSAQYVSQDMGGTADLDEAGDWNSDADYGPVWYPTTVAVGWAPYHTGHWVWEGPWGWTWVDDAPWGWAPYHYGRWAYIHNRWGWCPGPRIYAPVFAPALVAFVGGGGWGVSVGIGGPGVGWFPLGPREPFYPAYRTDIGYRERVNVYNYTNVTQITNVTNVTNITYVNRGVTNAVTVVPQRAFANGESVSRASVRVTPEMLRSAPLAPGHTAPVVPTARSLAPVTTGPGGRGAAVPPARLATRQVVATHAPPPAPVPFAAQQKALAANGGRPLATNQVASLRAGEPAAARTTFSVRPATLPVAAGHALTPARTNIAQAKPVTTAGFAARTTTPTFTREPPTPAPPAARPGIPAPPAARPATPTAPEPAQRVTVGTPKATPQLDQEYQQQRGQMEARHQQEFAAPTRTEPTPQLEQRQETEHQTLARNYEQAKTSGAEHMSAPAPQRAASPPREPSRRP